MNKFIRLLSLIIVICLVFTVSGCGDKGQTVNSVLADYEKGTLCKKDSILTYENDNLALGIDAQNCNISVTDKKTGRVWDSNPTSKEEIDSAVGVAKTTLLSQLAVNYVGNTNQIVKTNSYTSSVKKGTYEIYEMENGFRVEYKFDKGFTIPVSYTISDEKFVASILYSGITEGENLISTIEFLPYFGTASTKSQGFMFVPDGCGAVIKLNNGKIDSEVYSKKVYGIDESLPNDIVTTREEQIYLPVIGMNKDGGAFVATATEGGAESFVEASVSGVTSDFNSVYFKAIYRAAENLSVMNGSLGTAGLVLYSSEEPTDAKSFTVEYSFTQSDNASLGDMADIVRQELIKTGAIVKGEDKNKLYVDLYGGVTKQKSFVGIQYDGVEKLTEFSAAKGILNKLLDYGCENITAGYKNYSKNYFDDKIEVDLTPAPAIGGKKGLKEFTQFAGEKNIDFYFFADYYSFKSTGSGFSKYFDINKDLDLGATKIYPKKINTNIPNTSADPYYLLKPIKFVLAAEKILKSANKLNISGIYLGDISSRISGDYEIGKTKRSGAVLQAQKSAEILSEKSIMMSSPNLYMWKYADSAVDLPTCSSAHHIFDYDVPFLQMLLKGNIPYAGYEMNLYNASDDMLLKHIAFGQNLHYGFMAEDPSVLQNTNLINLYGLSNAKLEEASKNAKVFAKVYSYIKDLTIKDYIKSGNVTKTVYSDGTTVLVNYGDIDVKTDGVAVEKRGYTVVKNDKPVLTGGALE